LLNFQHSPAILLVATDGPAADTRDALFIDVTGSGGQIDNIALAVPEPARAAPLVISATRVFRRRRRT
jgi:hypothetical protein